MKAYTVTCIISTYDKITKRLVVVAEDESRILPVVKGWYSVCESVSIDYEVDLSEEGVVIDLGTL
jgi:hypothetical protein